VGGADVQLGIPGADSMRQLALMAAPLQRIGTARDAGGRCWRGREGPRRGGARQVARGGFVAQAALPGPLSTPTPLLAPSPSPPPAGAILFLASEWSGYVTGQVLEVNGGTFM
jgi:NAD(P)-dependent dehydrogenase (short-subunit alcohol dehydrogenase family)